jgi:hypothetical protein
MKAKHPGTTAKWTLLRQISQEFVENSNVTTMQAAEFDGLIKQQRVGKRLCNSFAQSCGAVARGSCSHHDALRSCPHQKSMPTSYPPNNFLKLFKLLTTLPSSLLGFFLG